MKFIVLYIRTFTIKDKNNYKDANEIIYSKSEKYVPYINKKRKENIRNEANIFKGVNTLNAEIELFKNNDVISISVIACNFKPFYCTLGFKKNNEIIKKENIINFGVVPFLFERKIENDADKVFFKIEPYSNYDPNDQFVSNVIFFAEDESDEEIKSLTNEFSDKLLIFNYVEDPEKKTDESEESTLKNKNCKKYFYTKKQRIKRMIRQKRRQRIRISMRKIIKQLAK